MFFYTAMYIEHAALKMTAIIPAVAAAVPFPVLPGEALQATVESIKAN